RMKMHAFHVLQTKAVTCEHTVPVAGTSVRRGAGEISSPAATRRQHHHLGREAVNHATLQVPGYHTGAHTVIRHDEVEREIFDEKLRVILYRLSVKRVQDGVAGTVGGGASALHGGTITEILHMAAKRPLVDLAFFRTAEGNTVMFEFIN